MRKVSLDGQAKLDMTEAVGFYNGRRFGPGRAFLEKFLKGVRAIQVFPAGYPLSHPPYRCHNMDRFPFGIIYDFNQEEIFIIAIKDHRRDPDFWKRRLAPV